MAKEDKTACSFCGRPKKETNILIAGISGHICDQCIDQASGIVQTEMQPLNDSTADSSFELQKPKEIKAFLDQYIIGQEDAKRVLSVAVYNHYKRLVYDSETKEGEDTEIEKSNVIFVGKTGTGKTLLAKTIARMMNVPFCIADATVITEAGYVGEDVESILSKLLQAADYKEKKAERGIIFIDEIDKIARKSDNPSITRDVSGEGVQQALLKLLEGTVVNVPPQGGRKHPDQKMIQIDTRNILFVCGGAFDGISKIIERRIKTSSIGFSINRTDLEITDENALEYISPPDLKSFGLIPELIGRFPIVCHLNPLDKNSLLQILTAPKNALVKQYARLFEIDGIKLTFDKKVLNFIVEKAIEYKLGARGLRSICEAILNDAMYELPSENDKDKLNVTAAYAEQKFKQSKLSSLKVA